MKKTIEIARSSVAACEAAPVNRPARGGLRRVLSLATALVLGAVSAGFLPGAMQQSGAEETIRPDLMEGQAAALPEAEQTPAARETYRIETAGRGAVLPGLPLAPVPPATIRLPDGVEHLTQHFDRFEYDLDTVLNGEKLVPRVYTAALPSDLPEIEQIDERKDVFLRILLPLVLKTNETILETRSRVEMLRAEVERGHSLDGADETWLREVAQRYGVQDKHDFEELLLRVDAAPVSLALVQAIQESGWGTSRFARDGNALFGQRTWSSDAEGFQPAALSGADFRVRAFADLAETVHAYVRNLNTGQAYAEFRQRRAALRADGQEALDGYELAGTLEAYSEEGQLYIDKLRSLMQQNDLQQFDTARLRSDGLPHVLVPDETIGHTQLANQLGEE